MKRVLFLTSFLLLIAAAAFAQAMPLTADDAVTMAMENNLTIQSEAIDLNIKKRAADTAWNSFIPVIDASAGINNQGTLFSDPAPSPMAPNPTDRNWIVNAGLSANLPINIALGTGIKQTRIDYENGLITYDDSRKKLNRDVRKYYYLLVATAADIELKKQNIEIAEKRYEQAKENYNNGLISELEMLQSQVSAENSKPVYNNQVIQYKNDLMNFKLLLGIPSSTELELKEGIENFIFYNFSDLDFFEKYSASRLDVLKINKTIESLENTKKLQAQYNRTPTLALTSGWSTSVFDGFDNENWKKGAWSDTFRFGLNLSIPLDDFIPSSKTSVLLENLDDQIAQLKLQRQMIFDAAEIEISNLIMALQNSSNSIGTYSLNVDLARKSFELTTEAYNLGTRELLDVETAQTEMLSASQNVLYEKINYINKLLDLEYAINVEDISTILEEK